MDLERPPLRLTDPIKVAPPATVTPEDYLAPVQVNNINDNDQILSNEEDSDSSFSDSDSDESKDMETDEKSEEKDDKEATKDQLLVVGKRRRSQPAKFSSDDYNTPKKRNLRRTSTRTPSASTKIKIKGPPKKKDEVRIPKRGSRCGKCAGCLRQDCGKCVYCKDKPKFGGPGKKKQRCSLRTCSNFEHKPGSIWFLKHQKAINAIMEQAGENAVSEAVAGAKTATTPATTTIPVTSATATPTSSSSAAAVLISSATTPAASSTAVPATSATTPATAAVTAAAKALAKAPAKAPASGSSASTASSTTITTTTTTGPAAQNSAKASSQTPTITKADVPLSSLESAKKALVTNQLTYAKVAMQLASTKQQIRNSLVKEQPPTAKSSPGFIIAPVLKQTISVTSKQSSSPLLSLQQPSSSTVIAAKISSTQSLTPTTSKISSAPLTVGVAAGIVKKPSTPLTKALQGSSSTTPTTSADTPKMSASVASKPAQAKVTKKGSTPAATPPVVPAANAGRTMVCVQCGRERSTSVARSSKFCTQRCIVNWSIANPGKSPKDAEVLSTTTGESSPTNTTTSPSSNHVPRALKMLQIDMAKPGTKLSASGSESESEMTGKDKDKPSAKSSVSSSPAQQKILESASLLSTAVMSSGTNTTPSSTLSGPQIKISPVTTVSVSATKQPAKVVAKRSVPPTSQQQSTPATKKLKLSTKAATPKGGTPASSQKSVSFKLNSNGDSKSSDNTSSAILSLASYLQPKKSFDATKMKLPPGFPQDIRQWNVSHVVEYFKATSDCADYVHLFEDQEVDGIALLLLTHEALVKCLGIKLGRAVKIMNRVQELKNYYEHKVKL